MTRYFTKEHEWIDISGDEGTVGISDFAQNLLGDITYVEVPAINAEFAAGACASVVESVKAASDIYAPMAGEVIAVNSILETQPNLVNDAPEDQGWIFQLKLTDPSNISGLMDAVAYSAYIAKL
jgi:glycine cleavage system H protein